MQICRAFVLAIILSMLVSGQTGMNSRRPSIGAVEEVLKLSKEYDRATVSGDASVLERILADEYRYIGATGSVFNKADTLKFARSGEMKLQSGRSDEVEARGFGNTVVLTGRWTSRGTANGKAFSDVDRYTSVYVKTNGRWRIVSDHVSNIPTR